MLTWEVVGRRPDLVTCALKIKGYIGKKKPEKKFAPFKKLNTIAPPASECNANLEGLHVDLERRYNDLLVMIY